jgi:hypothetical protein
MTRFLRWPLILVVIGVAVSLGLPARADSAARLSTGSAAASATADSADGAGAPAGRSDLLTDAATSAQSVGRAHPDVFGGLWIDRARGVVQVALTSHRRGLYPAFAGGYDAWLFRFPLVRRSWAELTALRDVVRARMPSLRASGVDLRAFYAKASINKVVLEVVRPTPDQITQLGQLLGADAILIRPVPDLPGMRGADRLNDTAPWNGGDFITSRYEVTCTSARRGIGRPTGASSSSPVDIAGRPVATSTTSATTPTSPGDGRGSARPRTTTTRPTVVWT